jgi:DNA polymerase elongation subunit (family B)
MKKLKATIPNLSGEEKALTERLVTVLDKRQLSYKVSANSMYGGMGVKKGYLPFLPGAMCTTARGRESIEKASKFLIENYKANLIYGDTDSCYISFPQYQSKEFAKDLDGFCRQVEDEISSLFPKPMKFAYEEAIYCKYLILSKKRYMALKCDLDGVLSSKIEKRGVLLSRRDNSAYSRDFYSKLIMKAFYKEDITEILPMMKDELNRLCYRGVSVKDLTISKSVGDIKDYKIRALPDDEKKLEKRLRELEINPEGAKPDILRKILKDFIDKSDCYEDHKYRNSLEYLIVEAYINKALPSQVQLAEKMRKRGTRVDAGERLGYVVIESEENIKDKLFNKIEDVDYFKENASILKFDSLYYTKLMINPMDEVLSAVYKKTDVFKKYYKARENYWKVVQQLNTLFSPRIKLI